MRKPALTAIESPKELNKLGPRLRAMRKQRGLTQEALGTPWFTKSYISAVELGRIRPSLKALSLLTQRLNVPPNELLADLEVAVAPDAPDATSDVSWSLYKAQWLVDSRQAQAALLLLDQVESEYSDYLENANYLASYRMQLLRGAALLQRGALSDARHSCEQAMELARRLEDGAEEVERARDLLGQVFYWQDLPHKAFEQHRLCMQAIEQNVVRQTSLRLTIFNDLAADYRALGDARRAGDIQLAALELASKAACLEEQAGSYWEASAAYENSGCQEQALRYGEKAINTLEVARNLHRATWLKIDLADLAIARDEYELAADWLRQAEQESTNCGAETLSSAVQERLSGFALRQGKFVEAAKLAQRSLELATTGREKQNALSAEPEEEALLAYARALRTSGLVAEANSQGQQAEQLVAQAIDALRTTRYRDALCEIEYNFAELFRGRGDFAAASEHYRRAYENQQYGNSASIGSG